MLPYRCSFIFHLYKNFLFLTHIKFHFKFYWNVASKTILRFYTRLDALKISIRRVFLLFHKYIKFSFVNYTFIVLNVNFILIALQSSDYCEIRCLTHLPIIIWKKFVWLLYFFTSISNSFWNLIEYLVISKFWFCLDWSKLTWFYISFY